MLSWLWSDPLPPGTPAPDFALPDDSGHTVKLSKLRGKNVALVFYPADNTPGCTRQLCDFRDAWDQARARGVKVFGVNPGAAQTHSGFRKKHKLPFPLLVDDGQKVAELYKANGLFVKRTVYLIGPDGVVLYSRRGAPQPAEVLAAAEKPA